MSRETRITLSMGALKLIMEQHLAISFGGLPIRITDVHTEGYAGVTVSFEVGEPLAPVVWPPISTAISPAVGLREDDGA